MSAKITELDTMNTALKSILSKLRFDVLLQSTSHVVLFLRPPVSQLRRRFRKQPTPMVDGNACRINRRFPTYVGINNRWAMSGKANVSDTDMEAFLPSHPMI